MKKLKRIINDCIWLSRNNIRITLPLRRGVTKAKRNQEVIISLTSFPNRIESAYKTLLSLLNQEYLPDRIILWLALEQFPDKQIPKKIEVLKKYGIEIKWWHDIKAYKKLIPCIKEYPNSIIVSVDDDWYYRRDMLRVLMEEHVKYPDEIIAHAITRPRLSIDDRLKSDNNDINQYRGTSSYYNKLLGGSGVLFPPNSLHEDVFKEEMFMSYAPTNDDIWFWAMAVNNNTRIRFPQNANGLSMMTNVEIQSTNCLSAINEGTYEDVTNNILSLYPQIINNLKCEKEVR